MFLFSKTKKTECLFFSKFQANSLRFNLLHVLKGKCIQKQKFVLLIKNRTAVEIKLGKIKKGV